MSDTAALKFAEASDGTAALPLHVIDKDGFEGWLSAQDDTTQTWLTAAGFKPALGKTLLIPDASGQPVMAVAGYGDATTRARGRFPLAAIAAALPAGSYALATDLPWGDLETECLGWLLSQYVFDRYKKKSAHDARLICPTGVRLRPRRGHCGRRGHDP